MNKLNKKLNDGKLNDGKLNDELFFNDLIYDVVNSTLYDKLYLFDYYNKAYDRDDYGTPINTSQSFIDDIYFREKEFINTSTIPKLFSAIIIQTFYNHIFFDISDDSKPILIITLNIHPKESHITYTRPIFVIDDNNIYGYHDSQLQSTINNTRYKLYTDVKSKTSLIDKIKTIYRNADHSTTREGSCISLIKTFSSPSYQRNKYVNQKDIDHYHSLFRFNIEGSVETFLLTNKGKEKLHKFYGEMELDLLFLMPLLNFTIYREPQVEFMVIGKWLIYRNFTSNYRLNIQKSTRKTIEIMTIIKGDAMGCKIAIDKKTKLLQKREFSFCKGVAAAVVPIGIKQSFKITKDGVTVDKQEYRLRDFIWRDRRDFERRMASIGLASFVREAEKACQELYLEFIDKV